jgi:hypothetical protein
LISEKYSRIADKVNVIKLSPVDGKKRKFPLGMVYDRASKK